MDLCPSCGGTGMYDMADCEGWAWETCTACDGTGEVE